MPAPSVIDVSSELTRVRSLRRQQPKGSQEKDWLINLEFQLPIWADPEDYAHRLEMVDQIKHTLTLLKGRGIDVFPARH